MGSTCGAGARVVALSGWADLAGTAPAPSSSHWGHDDTHPRQDRGPWMPRKGPVAQALPLHHFPTASSCAAQACSTTAGRAPSITPPVSTALISEGAGTLLSTRSPVPMQAAPGTRPLGTLLVTTPQHTPLRMAPCIQPGCGRLHHAGQARDVRGQACVAAGSRGVFLVPVSLPESACWPLMASGLWAAAVMTHPAGNC